VRYLNTLSLPRDETCLHLLEASCEADMRAVVEQAAIDVDRVVLEEQIDPREEESRTRPSKTDWTPLWEVSQCHQRHAPRVTLACKKGEKLLHAVVWT
jgi:hypothetical protein